jgi:RNA polymerase sigma-70 factor (ECF subfamily)
MGCKSRSEFRDRIVEEIPHLRAFACSLLRNRCLADDLVQATLLRALDNQHRFEGGTNLRAWLFTIQRNLFYSDLRKYKNEVEDVDGQHANQLTTPARPLQALEFRDFKQALAQLPDEQREALVLVGAAGVSYEEAAEICGCAIGTVKSRINRGRARLTQMLDAEPQSRSADRPRAGGFAQSDLPAPAGR